MRGTTNPVPCCHLANDTDLLTPVLWAMAGDNKQIDLWPADPFTRVDPKFNKVVPWSLHTFPENFMQTGPLPFSRNVADKERKKGCIRHGTNCTVLVHPFMLCVLYSASILSLHLIVFFCCIWWIKKKSDNKVILYFVCWVLVCGHCFLCHYSPSYIKCEIVLKLTAVNKVFVQICCTKYH